jgi:FtsH-binding integral membrane protein
MVNRVAEYFPYSLLSAAIIAAILDITLFNGGIVESFILWFLVIVVGLGSLYAFMGHAFAADDVARSIGWPPGSPFQFEVALHDLAVGLLGVLSFWLRGDFWSATVIAFAVFGLGAAYGHIRDMRRHRNFAPGNVGPVLYINDIVLPLLLVVLLIVYRA